jgi:uracil-DNA glycosylase family 4
MPLKGFFSGEEKVTKIPVFHSPRCDACKLCKQVESPKMGVSGEGQKRILICGEAPGETEDQQGEAFVGKTGQLLESTLDELGINMRRDCWIINAIRCRPWHWNEDKTRKVNRSPTDKEIAWCRPYTTGKGAPYGDMAKLDPDVVILLGAAAVTSVIGWLWKEDAGGINRWAGWRIPCQKPQMWICPTWHPSHVIREEKSTVLKMMWTKHLKAAVSLKGKPWKKGVPNYEDMVRVELIPSQAAGMIRSIIDMGLPTAFDIETLSLKPDSSNAGIISASMSNGAVTVSYLWGGEARQASLVFLESKVPKIGWNMKFETRYLRSVEGIQIKNWVWDGMLAAHLLDNRPDCCGLKFQAFASLGQSSYNDHIEPYLKAPTPNAKNKINSIGKRSLLLYGGLDAVLEYQMAKVQSKKMGVDIFNNPKNGGV